MLIYWICNAILYADGGHDDVNWYPTSGGWRLCVSGNAFCSTLPVSYRSLKSITETCAMYSFLLFGLFLLCSGAGL
jgi:hypothetical protein